MAPPVYQRSSSCIFQTTHQQRCEDRLATHYLRCHLCLLNCAQRGLVLGHIVHMFLPVLHNIMSIVFFYLTKEQHRQEPTFWLVIQLKRKNAKHFLMMLFKRAHLYHICCGDIFVQRERKASEFGGQNEQNNLSTNQRCQTLQKQHPPSIELQCK